MSDNSLKQRYEMLNNVYKTMPEPALRSMLKPVLDILGRQMSEEEPADDTTSQSEEQMPTPTTTNKNIANAIKGDDEFVTQGDNLEPGSSADNPIDSKSLTYEAQAQLPIGTWVTTSKGPHRINQGDKNWAKQQMQKTAQPPKASVAEKTPSVADKTKPATEKANTASSTVTTKPYYDTKTGIYTNTENSNTIPADKAADFAGNHTIYKSSSLPEDQQQALSSARKDARAKAEENKELYDDKSGPRYSMAGANAGKEVFEGAPIGQMPEVRALFQDKNNFVPISNLLKKAGKRDGLTADMTPQQVELMLTRVGDYIRSGSAEERAIKRFRDTVNSIAQSRYDEAQYQHLQETGSL